MMKPLPGDMKILSIVFLCLGWLCLPRPLSAITVSKVGAEIRRAFENGDSLYATKLCRQYRQLQNALVENTVKRYIRMNCSGQKEPAEKELLLIKYYLHKCDGISETNRNFIKLVIQAWTQENFEKYCHALRLRNLLSGLSGAARSDTLTKSNRYFEELGCFFELAENQYTLATIFNNEKQNDSALAHVDRAIVLTCLTGNIEREGRYNILKANLARNLNRFEVYRSGMDRALEIARSQNLHDLEKYWYDTYGNELYYLGYYQEASRQFLAADEICRTYDMKSERLYSLRHAAICFQNIDEVKKSDSLFSLTIAVAREVDSLNIIAWVILYQADYRLNNDDTLGLRQKLREAENIMLNGRESENLANVYYHLGRLEIIAGNYDEAVELLKYSGEVFTDVQKKIYPLIKLGLAFLSQFENDSALHYLTTAEQFYHEVRGMVPVSFLRQNYLKGKDDLVFGLIQAYVNEDKVEKAFEIANSFWARAYYETLRESETGLVLSAADKKRKQRLNYNMKELLIKIRRCSKTSPDRLHMKASLQAIQDTLMNIAFHSISTSSNDKIGESVAAEFVNSFNIDQAGLMYAVYRKHIFCWYNLKDELHFSEITAENPALMDSLDLALSLLSYPPRFASERERMNNLLTYLGRLIPDEISAALENIKELIIIPSGELSYFPFETVRFQDYYLCEKIAFEYYPSWEVKNFLARSAVACDSLNRVLIYGGTFSDRSYENCPVIDSFSLRYQKLTPLPGVESETAVIRETFPTSFSYIEQLNQEALLKQHSPEASDILHFATHGVILEDYPEFSGLILPFNNGEKEDNILLTGEIAELTLNNPLTVLSACQSGLGKYITGEGIQGLTKSFIAAGTRSLVVSLWPLSDQAGSVFMKNFYQALKEGHSTAEALQTAKIKLIEHPVFNHPYYWALLVAIGNWKTE